MARESSVGGDHDEILSSDADHGASVVRVGTEPPLGHPIVVVTQAAGLAGDLLYSEGLHTGEWLVTSAICNTENIITTLSASFSCNFQNLNSFQIVAPRNDKHISTDRCDTKTSPAELMKLHSLSLKLQAAEVAIFVHLLNDGVGIGTKL